MNFRKIIVILAIFAGALAARAVDAPASPADGLDFFEKRIRPLLAEKCFECHAQTAKKIKGGLLLDSREGWAKGGDTGPAIEPGRPDASLLIKAISWTDPDMQMPPKNKLAADDIVAVTKWIAMGAPDPREGSAPVAKKKQVGLTIEEGRKFWAFQPVKKIDAPSNASAAIDEFISKKLRERKLAPAPTADRTSLIRRVYFDLIGLPPTPEQIDAFVNNKCADAFARVVDELLASQHFGERWGRHWLDVARFAESSGGGRTLLFKDAWRFRDYVIDAFNRDVPFDQFIREQIAGDLLPAQSTEQKRRQITATGFLALGPTNYEEQDKAQLRMDVVDEQLDTIGKSFLALTIGCARCHDHKFDPIPTRDYYALAGILRSTRTLKSYKDNVARWIDTPLPQDDEIEAAIKKHEEEIAALQAKLTLAKALVKKASAGLAQASTKPGEPIAVGELPGIVVDDSDAKKIGDWKHSTFSKTYIGDGYVHDEGKPKGTMTLTFVPPIKKTGKYEVRFAYNAYPNRAHAVPVTIFHADGENVVQVDESETPPEDGRFISLGTFRFEAGGEGYVLVSNAGTHGVVVADAVQFLPVDDEPKGAAKPSPQSQADNKQKPESAELTQTKADVKRIEGELKKAQAVGPDRPVAMSVHDDADDISNARIHLRGSVKNLGDEAPRGFLQVALRGPAPKFSEKESGRLELAEWIASEKNPLTARVAANRVWHWLFGEGIVRTVDNFGVTGETPSHPELLDFLATRLVEDGWSVKKLIREIMLSRTYQQSAAVNSEALRADPENRLLWRANLRRLDAESIRDAILSVSGELKLDVGGPNIGGAGAIDANTTSAQNTEYGYKFTDTRRSVYTPAFRNVRLELFEAFDFGDINQTMGARNTSTVATQALYLMNHPFVIAQSRIAAKRALADTSLDGAARIDRAFRVTLGRLPSEKEKRFALGFVGSPGDADEQRLASWSEFYQMLFACVDFRYLN